MVQADSRVLELRLRLYRPDPPEDAVAAYLAALALETPPTAPVRLPPLRRRPHALAAAGVSVLLVAVVAIGVGLAWRASAAAAPVGTRAAATHLAVPSAPGYPIGELFGGSATTGLFDARGVHAVVSVLCAGDGTITLRLGPEPPTVLTCQAGGPALAMLASSEDLGRFTVSVAPQPHLRWSLAVGAMALPAH